MHRTALAGSLLALAATVAHAQTVLFDNYGPGDTYRTDMGMTLGEGGPVGGPKHEAAVPFTVTGGDFYFNTAEFSVILNWGEDIVFVDLRADDNGAPGQILQSTTASGVADPFELAPPMIADFGGSTILEDGATYWIAMSAQGPDALLSWAHALEDWGHRAWRLDGGDWQTGFGTPGLDDQRGVLRITGTLVPTPGAAAVFAMAALAGAARRRRA